MTSRRILTSFAPIMALLALPGCVTTQQDMEAMRSDINRMHIQIDGLQDTLKKMNQEFQSGVLEANQQLRSQNREILAKVTEMAEGHDVIKRNQADINAKMDTMTSGMQVLGGRNEEGQVSAMNIGARVDSMNATLNQRLDGMDRNMNQLGKSVASLEKQSANLPVVIEASVQKKLEELPPLLDASVEKKLVPVTSRIEALEGGPVEQKPAAKAAPEPAQATPDPVVTGAGETSAAVGDPMEIYQSAYADYAKGNFELAAEGFHDFLTNFPDAMLAPNAQYWLGECFYSQKKLDEAIIEFDRVIKNYPGAIKVPSAYLKKGFALEQKGDKEAANVQYRKILDAYPLAPEAAIAKEKLKAKK